MILNWIFLFFNNFTFGQCVNLRTDRHSKEYLLLCTLDRLSEWTMVKSNKNCNVPLHTFSSHLSCLYLAPLFLTCYFGHLCWNWIIPLLIQELFWMLKNPIKISGATVITISSTVSSHNKSFIFCLGIQGWFGGSIPA